MKRLVLVCVKTLQSLSQRVELTELRAYTTYDVYVTACTQAGCTPSPSTSLTTSSDLPTNLHPATIDNVTSTSVQLAWTDPQVPNGNILRSAGCCALCSFTLSPIGCKVGAFLLNPEDLRGIHWSILLKFAKTSGRF